MLLCAYIGAITYLHIFAILCRYADASGAGKDVYEFVSSLDGIVMIDHSIDLVVYFHLVIS